MNEHIYTKLILCGVILTVVAWCNWAQAQPVKPEPEQNIASSTDDENPFAGFFNDKNTKAQQISRVAQQIEEKPELFLESVTLRFLNAQNLSRTIENMSSEYGSITADLKSNSLVICDTNDVVKKILLEIKKADTPPPQLMIEAVIVDVQLDDDTEIGVNWDILSEAENVSYRQKLGDRLKMAPATADNIADATVFNTITDTATAGGYFALVSGTIRNTIHLLQERKNVEILASPRVMVVSGESASIETVTELPYQEISETSEGGQLTSTQFKKVGVKLNVTAVLTDDDYILVTLEPEQSVDTGLFGSSSEIPIIDTRKTKTTLLLRDGQVVVMGGLRKKETTNQVSQIPLLGDLPLVGNLFRNTRDIVKSSELLIFMSPHIYKGEPLSEQYKERFNEIRNKPPLSLPPKEGDDKATGEQTQDK
ncbi:MAG: hypothetical protein PVG93_02900 [Phycisphaerales bacterium]|jgi:type IV pilus assembly protein PilQ